MPSWSTLPCPAASRPCSSAAKDDGARQQVTGILDRFGWETEDLGTAEAARAIEPLCILWCIPAFREDLWTHAFKLLKA